jgi:hypothetical protein
VSGLVAERGVEAFGRAEDVRDLAEQRASQTSWPRMRCTA